MEKKKIIIVAVTLVLLVIVVVVGFRWIQGALFQSAKMIKEAGERPFATEEVWVSPTLSLEDYDQPVMPPALRFPQAAA